MSQRSTVFGSAYDVAGGPCIIDFASLACFEPVTARHLRIWTA